MHLTSLTRMCVGALILTLPTSQGGAQMTDEATIRSIRAASNAAIAGRDLGALRRTVFDDLMVTASSGDVFVGGDAMMERFRASFADPEFVTYVRIPDDIAIGSTGLFAAESGGWTGTWRKPDGEMRIRGSYMAQWQRRNGEWRIRSELFVALSCEGSAACPPAG
jgi:ketosteroid isomerase-like protein